LQLMITIISSHFTKFLKSDLYPYILCSVQTTCLALTCSLTHSLTHSVFLQPSTALSAIITDACSFLLTVFYHHLLTFISTSVTALQHSWFHHHFICLHFNCFTHGSVPKYLAWTIRTFIACSNP
jgi:hypothetical protein